VRYALARTRRNGSRMIRVGRGRAAALGDGTVWMWTLDAKLINLALVESIELLEVFPEGTDLDGVEDDALEPDYLELVAVLPSGREAVLFDSESAEEAQQAYEKVAAFVARDGLIDGLRPREPVSVAMLLERAHPSKN